MVQSFSLSRRRLIPAGMAAAVAPGLSRPLHADPTDHGVCTSNIPEMALPKRPSPESHWLDYSHSEIDLAFRNHGMLTELLREPITPLGLHYLLNHFDVPRLSSDNYTIAIGGRVNTPIQVSLRDLQARRAMSQVVTMECAGVGRAALQPRPVYVPWNEMALGTYEWIGTPLRPLLQQAGLLDDAVEILFTGWDSGVDLGVEHAFERSLPVADAMRPEVMLVWAANGESLLPQHGFPLRLVVPSWYGVASVKWLRAITALSEPFQGVQQARVYRYTQSPDDPGDPVREKRVGSLMAPPGLPDMLSRTRYIAPGAQVLEGAAWSGSGPVSRVEVSVDGGVSWQPAQVSTVSGDPFAWVQWRLQWQAAPGDYVLMSRATDSQGAQPLDPNMIWNYQGNGINAVKPISVVVQKAIGGASLQVPCTPRLVLPGAKLPPQPSVVNQAA
jgi:sulfane dehydrogenase subunit SoxC